MQAELLERIYYDGITDPNAGKLIRNPSLVRNILGPSFQYAQAVEAEVPHSFELVDSLWQNMSEHDALFFKYWLWQEQGHANSELSVLNAIGLPTKSTVHKVNILSKTVGTLAKATPGLRQTVEVGVLAYMALGEQETKIAYRSMAKIASEIGENDLAKVIGKTAHQENLHLQYQKTEALKKFEKLNNWQRKIVGKFIEVFYFPVGVQRNNHERMNGFGSMILAVSNDNGSEITNSVQTLATELLEIRPTSNFVAKRYKDCLEELRRIEV